jgi:hypothetical protein
MTEDEWLTRCNFGQLEDKPLYHRISVRQFVLLGVAWLRRYDRYWGRLPAWSDIASDIFSNRQMDAAINFLERWADGKAGPLELGEAVKDANEAAYFGRLLFEDLVEDNEEGLIEFRARVTEAASGAVLFLCEATHLCGDPCGNLADVLSVLGDRSSPNLPPFVLEREGRRRPRISTPQQRFLDCFESALWSLSTEVASEALHCSKDENAVWDAEGTDAGRIMRDIFGNPFRPVSFSPSWRSDTAIALAKQMYESRDFGAMPILADALQDAGCDSEDVLNHCRNASATHVRGCWVVDLVLGKL